MGKILEVVQMIWSECVSGPSDEVTQTVAQMGGCLLLIRMAQRRKQRVKQGMGAMQGVNCDAAGFPEAEEAYNILQGWQRAANYFLGGVNYLLHSFPVLSSCPCVTNTQAVRVDALHEERYEASSSSCSSYSSSGHGGGP